MRISFIFRESREGRFVASQILKKYSNTQLIVETGTIAKKNKLKRMFRLRKIHLWPIRFLDLCTLRLYELLYQRYFHKHVPYKTFKELATVADVNSPQCLHFISTYKPEVIIIFGTAIIRDVFLNKIKVPIYNIHTGILPKYRNVHSEFWAYMNKDFKNMGVTIIHLDKGIDSGDIALQEFAVHRKNERLFSLRLKIFQLIVPETYKLLELQMKHKVPKIKQVSKEAISFKTPSCKDLTLYFIREVLIMPATR